MARQKLTQEQIDKFYAEYVKVKTKNYAGDIMSKATWKNDVEQKLYMDYGNEKWSNNKIRAVSIQAAKRGAWSEKQANAVKRNIIKNTEAYEAFQKEFDYANVGFNRFVENNQGLVYAFLQGIGGTYEEFFDS